MRRPPIPLRVYLLLLVLGAMLPGAVLTAILVAQTFAGNRAVIERRLMDAARVDAAAVDRELDAIIRRPADVLATSPALAADDLQAVPRRSGPAAARAPGWYTVLLLSPEGKQIMSTRLAVARTAAGPIRTGQRARSSCAAAPRRWACSRPGRLPGSDAASPCECR